MFETSLYTDFQSGRACWYCYLRSSLLRCLLEHWVTKAFVTGLTADARSLCKLMRTECLEHHYVYESPIPVQRLVLMVADKCQVARGKCSGRCISITMSLQVCTQRASARPYGVGLLVAGLDQTGPHIYYNCPSGNYYEYKAMTIGARSQVRIILT